MSNEFLSRCGSTATYTGATVCGGSALAQAAISAAPQPAIQETILGLTLNQWTVTGVLFGMVMAFAGWITSVYFQRQRNKIIAKQHGDLNAD